MSNNDQFVDPLEALFDKHQKASGIISTSNEEESTIDQTDDILNNNTSDVDYGDNDLEEEIKKEDMIEAENRMKAIQSYSNNDVKAAMPPDEHDMKYHKEAIDYQADKIAIVTTMVNKVVAKHHLVSGGIDQIGIPERLIKGQREVMGDLIDIYHQTGDKITPEFEETILNNWILPSGITAAESIRNNGSVVENSGADNSSDDIKKENIVEEPPTINISVQQNTPVSVTVDESIIPKTYTSKEVNIHVKEVSEKQIDYSKIVENSQQDGIIKPYDSGINDFPITLPMSAYRCVMRPINWFDSMSLTIPTSDNPVDNEIKKWTVIYDHIKNPSIGEFESFEDFLKKTKYQDGELLLYGIFVATSDEMEEVSVVCRNEKCKTIFTQKYDPRSLVHIDEKRLPKHYQKTHDVGVGKAAIEHWKECGSNRIQYVLPDSGYIVEINDPSAYEQIMFKTPIMSELIKRFGYEGADILHLDIEHDPKSFMFDYLLTHALIVSAISIPGENGKFYRYTEWDKIEEIITKSLNKNDSTCLFKLVTTAKERYTSPMSFYLEGKIECPKCHTEHNRILINNVGEQLLFQVSRGLNNTTINLIEME